LIAASDGRRDLIPDISRIYNHICCPAGNKVLEASRESGQLRELAGPGFEDVVEGDDTLPLSRLVKLFDYVEESWRWASESAENVREQAVTMLAQASVSQNLKFVVFKFSSEETCFTDFRSQSLEHGQNAIKPVSKTLTP